MVWMIICRPAFRGTGGLLLAVLALLVLCSSVQTDQHQSPLALPAADPAPQQQKQHGLHHHFWRWSEPQQHAANSISSTRKVDSTPSEKQWQQQQQMQQYLEGNLDRRLSTFWAGSTNRPSSLLSSSSSRRRKLLQITTAAAAAPYQPPRVLVSQVQATVTNSYSWEITRRSSATSLAVTADGSDRKQMGYTLTFTRNLQSRTFIVEGSVDITNVMGTAPLTLLSVTVYVGTTAVNPACRTLPGSSYVMQPTEVLSCPFRTDLSSDPGGPIIITAFVQTSNGRKSAENTPPPTVSFTDCSSTASSTAACVVRDVGRCVTVTDGSRIISRYQDKAGAAAAGPIQVSQSQLFEVNDVALSTLGPPRLEPTLPDAPPPAEPPPESAYVQPVADDTWWTGRRRGTLRRSLTQSLPLNLGSSSSSNGFTWPIPQITGVRPPVGLLGKPAGVEQPQQICDTTPFAFSMIFGPLKPEACGIFEVVSTAAAAYVDNSQPPVTHETYAYLQVICPPPQQQQDTQQQQQQVGTPNMLMGNRFQSLDQSQPDSAAAAAGAPGSSNSSEDLGPAASTATTSATVPTTAASSSSTGSSSSDDSITGGGSSSSAKPPDLRVSIIESRPVLLTSYSWSLTGGPAARTNPENNVTEVGCWLRAERGKGSTTQIVTGTVRLGNPVAPTDPGAVILYVKSVSVTTVITSGAGRQARPVTVPAECRNENSNGEVQLMPFHRVNCTFEMRVTTAATPVFPLTGNILATAVVQVSRGSSVTLEVTSTAYPFTFQIPAVVNVTSAAAAAAASSSNGATQQVAVGSCARLSSGVVVADMLPMNSTAAAAADGAAAAAAVDGEDAVNALLGSSGECVEVCGAEEPEREVTYYAPVDGYNKYQCGEHTVSCIGAIIPDNGAWQGAGQLSPAVIVTNTTVTVDGNCYNPNAAAAAANATDGSSGSGSGGTAGDDDVIPPDDGAGGNDDADSAGDYPADDEEISNPAESPAPDDAASGGNDDAATDDEEYRDYDPEADTAGAGGNDAAAGNGTVSSSTNRLNAQQVTYAFRQAAAGSSSSSGTSVFLPLIASLQQVTSERMLKYAWNNRLNLATAPATTTSSSSSSGLTLTARYTRSTTPVTGTIRGQVQLQAAAAAPSGLLRLAATAARNASVLLLLPCGGSIAANITGAACSASEITLPATCEFEAAGVDVAAAPAVVVVARAQAVVPVSSSTAASSSSSSSSANGTSNSTTPLNVLITVQSVPQVVTFSKSPEVEVDRCVNVTSNFRLTAAGDVSSADGVILTTSGSSSSSAVNASSSSSGTLPLLVPVSPLPDALCGNSQIQYKLTAGGQNAAAAVAPGV